MAAWTSRHTAGALGWVLGTIGVLLALDAVQGLALVEGLLERLVRR